MQRRAQIARLLLVVTFMFTMVFQFADGLSHMVKTNEYLLEHHDHAHFTQKSEITSNSFEWKENHHSLDKCFSCEMIPYSAILPEISCFTSLDNRNIEKRQQVVIQQFKPLAHVYYSLRAPPFIV